MMTVTTRPKALSLKASTLDPRVEALCLDLRVEASNSILGSKQGLLELHNSSKPCFRAKEAKKIPLYDKNSSYFLAKKGRQESGGVGGLEASTLCTGSRLRPPTGSRKSRFPESILLRLNQYGLTQDSGCFASLKMDIIFFI